MKALICHLIFVFCLLPLARGDDQFTHLEASVCDLGDVRQIPLIARGTIFRKAMLSMLEIGDKGQSLRTLFQEELENSDLPQQAYAFNHGRHLVTLNNRSDEGLEDSVVIYDFLAKKRRSLALKDFCSAEDMKKIPRSVVWKGFQWTCANRMYPVPDSNIVYIFSYKAEGSTEREGLSIKINLGDLTVENLGWKADVPPGLSETDFSGHASFFSRQYRGIDLPTYRAMRDAPKVPLYMEITLTEKGLKNSNVFDFTSFTSGKPTVFKWEEKTQSYRITNETPTVTETQFWLPRELYNETQKGQK